MSGLPISARTHFIWFLFAWNWNQNTRTGDKYMNRSVSDQRKDETTRKIYKKFNKSIIHE